MSDALVALLVALPLLGAALGFGLGRRLAGPIAGLTIAALAGVGAAAVAEVWRAGELRLALGGWPAPLGITLAVDGLAALLIAATIVVFAAVAATLAAWLRAAERPPPEPWLVWPLALLALTGVHAALLARDLFNLYVALELIGLSSVALIAFVGGATLVPALRYLLVTLLGSLLYLLGVALIYADYGLVDLAALAPKIAATPATRAALVVMTVGLLFKLGLVPLHVWLAPAHGRALGPIAALLSGIADEVVLYVLARVWIELFAGAGFGAGVGEALGLLGALAIVWASAQALRQDRLKPLVAYSTVAQLGYLALGFALGPAAWPGVAVFIAAHACAKAAMFQVASEVELATGSDALAQIRGLATRAPASSFAFALAGVALIGLPPSGLFFAKWLLLDAAIAARRWAYVAVIAGGSLLAAAYVFRVLALALRRAPDRPRLEPIPRTMQLASLTLALVAVTLGLAAAPTLALLERGDPFAHARAREAR